MKGIMWQLERERLLRQAIDEAKAEIQKEQEEKSLAKKEETTLKQQVLILHYLGILKYIELPVGKKAELLSTLLNKSQQDIKVALTYVNGKSEESKKIKTENNLKFVKKHFEKLKLPELTIKIDKDLESFLKE